MRISPLMIRLLFFCCAGLCTEQLCAEIPDTNENAIVVQQDQVTTEQFFTAAELFFKTYVQSGKVNYSGLKNDPAKLNALKTSIGAMDLSAANADTKLAFYLNAYNVLVIAQIVEHFPVKSPLDIAGFFDQKKFQVAGTYMTLNDLENNKLRPDPRVHFSLVCGALGCPRLQNTAFIPDQVQSQLNDNTVKAINDNTFIRVDDANKKVQYAQIFDWYKDDFIRSAGSVNLFINNYRTTKIPQEYNWTSYTYDWKVNGE